MENAFTTPGRALGFSNYLYLVLYPVNYLGIILLTRYSMIPESPRFLISKDRRDEAYRILVTYHAEGDPDADFAKAEMAQIESTIRLELEHSRRSWWEMLATPGMRKRVIIGSMLGLFTQWSGNTLISYVAS